jgi:hypothetical protein
VKAGAEMSCLDPRGLLLRRPQDGSPTVRGDHGDASHRL